MRRVLVLASVVLLLGGGSVDAGKPRLVKSRVVSVRYVSPGDVALGGEVGGFCTLNGTDPSTICAVVEPRYGENYVSVEVRDVSPLPVAAMLMQNAQEIAQFCGETNKPIWISSVDEVQFWAGTGQCADGSASIATAGEAIFTFYRAR